VILPAFFDVVAGSLGLVVGVTEGTQRPLIGVGRPEVVAFGGVGDPRRSGIEFDKGVKNQFGPFLPDRGEKPRSRMRQRMIKPHTMGCVVS